MNIKQYDKTQHIYVLPCTMHIPACCFFHSCLASLNAMPACLHLARRLASPTRYTLRKSKWRQKQKVSTGKYQISDKDILRLNTRWSLTYDETFAQSVSLFFPSPRPRHQRRKHEQFCATMWFWVSGNDDTEL